MKKSIILLLLFVQTIAGIAQESKVLVTNSESGNGTILIKWYSNQLWYPYGVNIYRKEMPNGEWEKLNRLPIKKLNEVNELAVKNDSSLQAFAEMINEIPIEKLEGFTLLSGIIKSIQSTDFAKYLGILFEDENATIGKTYKYKVMKIRGVAEINFETSPEIIAGKYLRGKAPDSIIIDPGHHKAAIKWKPDEDSYYAVNIYRSSDKDDQKIKVNDLPIMLSTFTDETGKEKYAEYFFVDDSLKNDITYYYELKSIDFFGRESEPSDIITITVKDIMPPPPPLHLRKSIDRYTVGISWDIVESPDLEGFNVYRSSNDRDNYQKVNKKLLEKTDTFFVETIEKSAYYYYQIAAVDKAGNEALSNKLLLKVEDNTPPLKPKNLIAIADTGSISLTWDMNNEEDLIGYLIYRKIEKASEKEFALMNEDYIKKSFFVDTLAINIKNKFVYKIAAVDSALNISEFSNIVMAQLPDIIPPEKPVIINSISMEAGVQIEWIPNVEPDLKGYHVFRISPEDTMKLNEKIISPAMHLFTDRFALPGIKYKYTIKAVDLDGNQSAFSDPFPGMMKRDSSETSAIEKLALKYKKRKKQVTLEWSIRKHDLYKGIVIYRKQEGQFFKPLTGIIDRVEYIDKDIKPATKYFYKVKVFDSSGKASVSNIEGIRVEE